MENKVLFVGEEGLEELEKACRVKGLGTRTVRPELGAVLQAVVREKYAAACFNSRIMELSEAEHYIEIFTNARCRLIVISADTADCDSLEPAASRSKRVCFLPPPFFPKDVAEYIRKVTDLIGDRDAALRILRIRTSELLHMAGFEKKFAGFGYMLEAVSIVIENAGRKLSAGEELYGEIGARCGCSADAAETAIRSAAKRAFPRMQPGVRNELFGSPEARPPCRKMIYAFAEYLAKKERDLFEDAAGLSE